MKKDPWFRNRLIRDGIYRALHEEMTDRKEIVILGEGSHMKIHFDSPAIERDFSDRVLTMPISEDGNTNFAVGMALRGVVPVVDVISSDFLFRTMDAICNTVAKVNYVHDPPLTIVIRAEFLTGGPTTGQRIERLFCSIPGLRVAVPSNPQDAYAMMFNALNHPGATIFFEDRTIEDATTLADLKLEGLGVGARAWASQTGAGSRFGRREDDAKVTVVSYGRTYRQCETLFANDPRVELIDLRWLSPLDVDEVALSSAETGKLLIVEPGPEAFGISAELQAAVWEREARETPSRVIRIGAPMATIPAARELHDRLLPTDDELRRLVEGYCEVHDFEGTF